MQGGEVQQIVRELQEGHRVEENFHRLFERYYHTVRRFFIRRGFSPEQTLDLTQETFLRAFQGIDSFRGDSSFDSWLFQIAINVWRMRQRRSEAGMRSAAEIPLPDPFEARAAVEQLTSPDLDPLVLSLREERRHALRHAVEDLPQQMKRIVILRIYHDMKYREIAALMGISIDTVKSHLAQARSRLRSALGEDTDADDR